MMLQNNLNCLDKMTKIKHQLYWSLIHQYQTPLMYQSEGKLLKEKRENGDLKRIKKKKMLMNLKHQ